MPPAFARGERTVRVSPCLQKIALQFKAQLDNITALRPEGEDFRWYLKVYVLIELAKRLYRSCVRACLYVRVPVYILLISSF